MPLNKLNFRDLGGLLTRGGAIRPGVLFRSEGPANFLPEHQSAIEALGIRNIIDLRSQQEREKHPHDWQGERCKWQKFNVDADLRVFGNEGRERLLTGDDPQIAIAAMQETYREIPDALLPHWAQIGECLLDGKLPALINCTAGKDRTGIVVAMILEVARVPRDVIMQDYMRSHIFGDNFSQSGKLETTVEANFGFLPSRGQIDALIGVRPDYLHAAWDAIDQRWSGVPQYLASAGMNSDVQKRIEKSLVAEGVQAQTVGELA